MFNSIEYECNMCVVSSLPFWEQEPTKNENEMMLFMAAKNMPSMCVHGNTVL